MNFTDREKELLLSNAPVLSRIHLYDQDGSLLQVFNENDYLVDWDYEDFRYVPDQGFIGQFVERLLDGHLMNIPEDLSLDDKEIDVEIAVVDPLLQTQVYHNYGRFIITKVEQEDTTGSYKFESSDYAKKFNVAFKGDEVTYPCTALELLNHACEQAGVELNSGKNLFDKDDTVIYSGYFSTAGKITGMGIDNGNNKWFYIPCLPNTTYTITKPLQSTQSRNRFRLGTTTNIPANNNTLNDFWYMNDGGSTTIHTITTGANANYLCMYYAQSSDNYDDAYEILDGIQIEYGFTATSYEAYPTYSYIYTIPEDGLEAGNYYFKDEDNYYNFTLSEDLKLFDSLMLIGDRIIQRTITDDYKVVETNIYYTTSNSGTGTELEGSKVSYIDFTNNNFVIENNQFEEQDSCRNVVTSIAKLSYTWARINEDNVLKLDFSKKVEEDADSYNEIDTDKYYEATVTGNTFGPVNKVVVGMSNVDGENIVNGRDADELSLVEMQGETSQRNAILPSTYTQVDYIESSGAQYIDTNFNPTPKTKIESTFAYNQVTPVQQRVFGNSYSETDGLVMTSYINGSGYFAWACNNNTGNWTSTGILADTNKHTIILDSLNNVISLDDYSGTITSTRTNNATTTMLLFTYRGGTGTPTAFSYLKLYSTKIYDNKVLVRDFIPCYRNSDNVIGLYDLVNNVFYTNQGTGTFTKGSDSVLPNPDYPQDMHNISGNNTVNICGKNILEIRAGSKTSSGITSNYNFDTGLLQVRGTATGNWPWIVDTSPLTTPIPAGSTITFSINKILVGNITARLYYSATEYEGLGFYPNHTANTRTVTHDITRIAILVNYGTGTVVEDDLYLQLEYGSQATPFEVYKRNSHSIDLPVENLFNPVTKINGTNIGTTNCNVVQNNDILQITASSTTCDFGLGKAEGGTYLDDRGYLMEVKPSTKYSLSINSDKVNRIYFNTYDENKISLGGTNISISNMSCSYTTPANARYMTAMIRLSNTVTGETYDVNVQVNEGNPSAFAPYGLVPIGENLFDINEYTNAILRGGGNGVALTKEDDITLKALNKISQASNYCLVPIPNSDNLLGKTITISGNATLNNVSRTRVNMYFISDTTYIGSEILGNTITSNGSFTLTGTIPSSYPSGATRLALGIYGSGSTAQPVNSYVLWKDIRIEEGSISHKNVHSIELNKINTYKDKIFKTSGKNILNKYDIIQDSRNIITQLDTGIRLTCNQAGAYRWSQIPLKNPNELLGKTVTISANLKYSGTNDAQIMLYFMDGSTAVAGTGISATTTNNSASATGTIPSTYPSGTNSISLLIYSSKSSTTVGEWIEYTNLQVELNDTKTEYEPYSKDEWYKIANIDKKVFTGASEEGWTERTNTAVGYYKVRTVSALNYDMNGTLNVKSNYFIANTGANNTTYAGNAICGNGSSGYEKRIQVSVEDTIANSVANWETWLSTHNLIVYYVSATPEYQKITYQPLIDQLNAIQDQNLFNGINRITIEPNDEIPTLKVSVKDIDNNKTTYEGKYIDFQAKTYESIPINIFDNPLTHSEALRRIAINGSEKLFGIRYTPMEVDSIGHPWLEGNEFIKVTNLEDKDLYFYPFDRKMTYKGYLETNLSAQSKNEVSQKYENKNTLLDRMHHTEIDVDKANGQISLISNQTDVNTSDISNITINVNSITNSVESIQNTTIPTINSNIDNISGDIDTINNQINTIQNTELTNIVSRLSQVEQTAESITNMFQISGGINIIRNSAFLLSDNLWEFTNNGTNPYYTPLGSSYNSTLSGTTTSVAEIKLRSIKVKSKSENITNLKSGTKYTFNFYHKQDNNMTTTIKMYSTENNSSKAFNDIVITGQQAFKNYEVSFTPTTYSNYTLEIIVASTASVGYSYLYDMMLNAGDKQSWQPASDEIYSTTLTMSRLGLQVYSVGDGTITLLGSEGLLSYETSDGRTRGRLVSKRTVDGDLVVSTTAQNLYLAQDISQVAQNPSTTPKWVTTVAMVGGRLSEVKYLESGGQ